MFFVKSTELQWIDRLLLDTNHLKGQVLLSHSTYLLVRRISKTLVCLSHVAVLEGENYTGSSAEMIQYRQDSMRPCVPAYFDSMLSKFVFATFHRISQPIIAFAVDLGNL